MRSVYTIDLHFLGMSNVIGVYAIPHKQGVVLIENGPGSTIPYLEKGLKTIGYSLKSVTDVFLTHIHLDHASASGILAREGARIHVHPKGAGHIADPARLLASASRIYGDQMKELWGEFLPVPEENLNTLSDNQTVKVNEISITALDTPGHAEHHLSFVFEDICFTGDIGGIRFPGRRLLRLPTPPPDFHLEKWRRSLGRLKETGCKLIGPAHFGLYSDIDWQLDEAGKQLDEIEAGMKALISVNTGPEGINTWLVTWLKEREKPIDSKINNIARHETLSPIMSSATGTYRYWTKYRLP